MPTAVPMKPWKWPSTPWSRIHLDFTGPFLGHMFLIIIDAYSKWLEVRIMKSTTSSAIITTLCSIFAQFGLPSIIVTDNARNFTSTEFESFLNRNGIKHLSSPAYHPSSNGLAERAVQSFKQSLLKLTTGSIEEKVSHVLFYSHITPNSVTGFSPAELLQNRRLRSRLDLMKPDFNGRMIHQQFKQQFYANLHSKPCGFKDGDSVYIRNFGPGTKWIPGQVLSSDGSVSFNVSLQGGRTVRRHTDHICCRTEQQIYVPILDERNQDTTDETPLVDPQSSVNLPSLKPPDSPPVTSSVDPPSDQFIFNRTNYPTLSQENS